MALAQLTARRRQAVRIVGIAAVAALTATYVSGAQAARGTTTGTETYIVQMAGAPIASYTGDVPGLAATKPARGKKVDTRSSAATAYRAHLGAQRGDALRQAGLSSRDTIYTYDVALNGFAMKLTATEAARLEHTSGVTRVWKSERFTADTTTTPGFLGLTGGGGVWQHRRPPWRRP